MARLRYNGLTTTLGADLTSGDTTITFAAALSSAAGAVPTISGSDTIALSILDATGAVSEIVSLTAYTSGATSGTIARAQEGTTAAAHTSGDSVVHGPTTADFTAATSSAPTVRASTSGYSSSGATFNATIPAGAQTGDTLLLFSGANNSLGAAPTGWTTGTNSGAQAFQGGAMFYKLCGATDPGTTVTVTLSGGTEAANWFCIAVAGGGRYAPNSQWYQAQSTTSLACGPIFGMVPNALVLAFGSARVASATLSVTGLDSAATVASRTDATAGSAVFSGAATNPKVVNLTSSLSASGFVGVLATVTG